MHWLQIAGSIALSEESLIMVFIHSILTVTKLGGVCWNHGVGVSICPYVWALSRRYFMNRSDFCNKTWGASSWARVSCRKCVCGFFFGGGGGGAGRVMLLCTCHLTRTPPILNCTGFVLLYRDGQWQPQEEFPRAWSWPLARGWPWPRPFTWPWSLPCIRGRAACSWAWCQSCSETDYAGWVGCVCLCGMLGKGFGSSDGMFKCWVEFFSSSSFT